MARFFSLPKYEQDELQHHMYDYVFTHEYNKAVKNRVKELNKQPYQYNDIDDYFGQIAGKFRDFMNRHKEEEWKMHDVFKLFPNLHPKDGYILDIAEQGDEDSISLLYFHRTDATKVYGDMNEAIIDDMQVIPFSEDTIIKGMIPWKAEVPDIFLYIEMDGSIESYIQAFLLNHAYVFLPKGWHGCYNDREFIFKKK